MKISIVIPAFNEAKLLPGTLTAVRAAAEAAFTPLDWASELIVCDNNSTDHTGDVARAAGAVVVFEPRNQIARARNTGAAAATGDWFIFVDADSRPTAGLLRDVAARIQEGRWLAGGSTVRLDQFHLGGAVFTWLWNWISRGKRWMAGSFIWVDAAAFREVGGFSEDLYASEEIDLSRRLGLLARRRGRRLTILHRHPLETSARKMRLYSVGEIVGFLLRTVVRGGQTLRRREDCPIWYDGRR